MRYFKLPLAMLALLAVVACGSGKSGANGGSNGGSNTGYTAGSRAGSNDGGAMTSGTAGQMPNCGAVRPVWVNLRTRKYHQYGDPAYGQTKHGEYLCPAQAQQQGYVRAGAGSGGGRRHHRRRREGDDHGGSSADQSAGDQTGASSNP